MMTSRERILKSLRGEPVDRVSVCLFLADQGHFINQICPDIDPWDFETLQLKIIEFQKSMGFDILMRVLYMDPQKLPYIIYGGVNANSESENWEVTKTYQQNGTVRVESSTIRTPKGTLTQDFTYNEIRPGTFLYACTKKPVISQDDFEIVRAYEPAISENEKNTIRKRMKVILDAVGDDGIVGAWTPGGPFNNAACIINHEELYTMGITDPEYYQDLLDFTTERINDYTRTLSQAGADALCTGGNVGGAFLGRSYFDNFILPYEQKYAQVCKENNKIQIYHNCGQIMGLLESYKAMGVSTVEPFSPHPLGDGDIKVAKLMIDGKYSIIAGIDHVNILQKGTIEMVENATKEAMLAGKAGGGFIMQNVDFLEYGTPVKNVEVYLKTAMKYADY